MPPLPSSPTTPKPSNPKVPFKDSVWRPIVCCGSAMGVGLLLAPVILHPVKSSSDDSLPEIVLAGSSTMVLKPSPPPGVLLRGQLRLVADTTGTAPVAGEVARQVVPAGTVVKKGDPIVQISTGAVTRAPLAAESTQSAAEKAQIDAANDQTALSQKIVIAQSGLRAAQDRVDQAQKQVSAARDLVRRLQNGETVAASQLPAAFRSSTSESSAPAEKPRHSSKKHRSQDQASEAALQAAQVAHDAARDGAKSLTAARTKQAEAEKTVQDADDKLKVATKAVVDVEARFDAKKASAADVEAARSSQKEAQANVTSSLKALNNAQTETDKSEKAAAQLQDAADKSQAKAAGALKNAHLFDETPDAADTSQTATVQSPDLNGHVTNAHVTLEQAATFASAALDESRRAARDADRMRSEVDDYQRQVKRSSSQTETANQNLQVAQKNVLASVPRAKFTPALAPDDGVVTWVARLAREVGVGESVFGLSRGTSVNASFEDNRGLWKKLKKGMTLTAFVAPPSAPSPVISTVDGPVTTVATSLEASPLPAPSESRVLVTVKVTNILEPITGGQTATIAGDVAPASDSLEVQTPSLGDGDSTLQAGEVIMASVADPTAKPILSVPTSALVERDGARYVAVLKPAPSEADSGSNAPDPKKAAFEKRFVLSWQQVKTGRTDGLRQEIMAGLTSGTRIVAVTTQLEDLDLLPQSQKPIKGAQRQENASLPFVVRLTTS